MNTNNTRHRSRPTTADTALTLLRWLARGGSLISLAVLALFAFGGHEPGTPTPREWALLALFPIGVAAGLVLAWWKDLAGGVLALACLTAFHIVMQVTSKEWGGAYFALLTSPAVLFVVVGVGRLARERVHGTRDIR